MDRAQKEQVVEELGQVFSDSGAVVVCHYAGLTVAQMEDFRGQMREAGGFVRVAKNRLAKIALEGKPCEGLSDHLTGQTVFCYSEDPVVAPKVVDKFAKVSDKLVVIVGAMGDTVLDPAGVKALAAMPSREEVLASIIGAVAGQGGQLIGAISGPAGNLAGLVQAVADRAEAS